MKIRVISRSKDVFERETKADPKRTVDTPGVEAHPFMQAREYTRAVVAAKMSRMFSQPFVAAMSEHHDGVYALAVHPVDQNKVASASSDGEVRFWNLSTMETRFAFTSHTDFVGGLVIPAQAPYLLLSASRDRTSRAWNTVTGKEVAVFTGSTPYRHIDHNYSVMQFACAGESIEIYDHARSSPLSSLSSATRATDVGGYLHVRYNINEPYLLGACSARRSVTFFDTRISTPTSEFILKTRPNSMCWNPQEPMCFVVGCDDASALRFDYRNLGKPLNYYRGHVNAVMDVDYSRTGAEIVTAGYDRSVRIWNQETGAQRDIYTGRRMGKVFSVRFSTDTRFILSASDDGNVRVWKTLADEPLYKVSKAEAESIQYRRSLVEKFGSTREVGRIARQRPIPQFIRREAKRRYKKLESQQSKEERMVTRGGTNPEALPSKDPVIQYDD